MSRKLSKRPPGKETVANAGVCGDVRAWPAEKCRHTRPALPPHSSLLLSPFPSLSPEASVGAGPLQQPVPPVAGDRKSVV